MTKDKNVKKTLEAGALLGVTARHSEGICPKNPLHILKRFFAEYKFPFAGNCVRPAQNDGKILTPLTQDPTPKSKISTLSHTARSFTGLASSSVQLVPQGAGIHVMHLFTPQKTGLLRRFAPRNDEKFLVPQCLSNLVSFSPLSLPSPSRGEGCNDVNHLSTYTLINLSTYKRKDCTTMKNTNNVKNLFTYSPIHLFTPKKKAAFTLAEVLITLGIIGVVAAMTIPNLIAEQQKRTTVTKLQRAMSVLNQAYRRAYDDVGEATAEEAASMGSKEYFNKYWAPYLKILHICKSYKDCGYDSPQPYTAANGQKSTLTFFIDGFRVPVQTADGFIYTINIKAGNESTRVPTIVVDINGGAKPNKYGKDIFFFIREIDGEKGGVVRPYGYNETSFFDIDSSCTKSGVGEFCAEKIRRAGWQIDKSYPW